MMKDRISIIIPVYNVEDYLDRCVESIVNQTYRNLEIILVDDGSTDNSGTKCDAWAQKDNRIKVIHKENGGLSDARNAGLDVAIGDYIGFVDSDDYIDSEMYQYLSKIMIENDCDIVECSMYKFQDKNEKCSVIGSGNLTIMNREEIIKDYIQETHLTCTVPNMLLKSSIAKKVMFDVGKTHEDILWSYRVFVLSKKVVYVDLTLYFYFQRPNSIMNKKYSEKRFDALYALEERAKLVKTDYPQCYHLAAKAYLGACMYQYQFLCRQQKSEEYDKYLRILYNRFCNGDQKALFYGLKIKYKIWYSLFRIAPKFTCLIRNELRIGL